MKRVLLAQCCDPPHFYFIAEKLRKMNPEWQIDLLAEDHRHTHFYMNRFNWPGFHVLPLNRRETSNYEAVLFPLFSRGYTWIKGSAWSIPSEKYQVDLTGKVEKLSLTRLCTSVLRRAPAATLEFESFARQFPLPPLSREIIVIGECRARLKQETVERLKAIFAAGISVRQMTHTSVRQGFQRLHSQHIDAAIVYLSSRKRLPGPALLPLVLRIKDIVTVNENGYVSLKDPPAYFRLLFHRLIWGAPFCYRYPKVLFVQTEEAAHTKKSLQKLSGKSLFPEARVFLLCRDSDLPVFEDEPSLERSVVWRRKNRFTQSLKIWRAIRDFQPDLNCASFTGRSIFRIQKLGFFLLGARRKLAFNASHDAYWLSLRTLPRVFRKDLFEISGERRVNRVLLLETSGENQMSVALQTIQEPKVVPNADITVFCRGDKTRLFEGRASVISYSKESLRKNLVTLWKLFGHKPDVLAAVFAGSKIYPKQRLLFWLLPARSRLAFNENLDCLYVNRRNFQFLMRASSGPPGSLLRTGIRGILFFPRFFYLLAWWTGLRFQSKYKSRFQ